MLQNIVYHQLDNYPRNPQKREIGIAGLFENISLGKPVELIQI